MESLHEKYDVLKGADVESVEEWEKSRDIVKKGTNDVSSIRCMFGQRRN